MALKFTKKPSKEAVATVTTAVSEGKETKAENVTEEIVKDTPATKVATMEQLPVIHVSLGQTINMGNYSSARVDVGISIPCPFNEIDAVYEWAETWVNNRVKSVSDQLTGADE